ncbi:MarR family winged helix-turn-helix transcriptional regulator [Aquabacterium sp.]|uniref:MarR family winged helix-turn-helix transcriptional regulator n=1 Tax=Aquabacterium sp. TaxID=1872578 RepID=UPI00378325C6
MPRLPTPGTPAFEALTTETPAARLRELSLGRVIGYQLAQASVVADAVFAEVVQGPDELRMVEFSLLALLLANGEATPVQIANALRVSRSYITNALDRLDRRQLVQRSAHETDGRAQKVRLTPQGTAMIQQSTARLLEAEATAYAPVLTPTEQLMLGELLHKLARARRPPRPV